MSVCVCIYIYMALASNSIQPGSCSATIRTKGTYHYPVNVLITDL